MNNSKVKEAVIKALEIQLEQDCNSVATSAVKIAKIIEAWFTSTDYHDRHNSLEAMSKNNDLIGLGMIDGTICAIMDHGVYTTNMISAKEIKDGHVSEYELVLTTMAIRTVNRQNLSLEDRGLDNIEAWEKLTGGTVICSREGI